MERVSPTGSDSPRLLISGLGPGDLARLPRFHREILEDSGWEVIVRTLRHPAASQLADRRPVASCDDLYAREEAFEDVYAAIAERVMASAAIRPTIYAVPGSPWVGEFAVRRLVEQVPAVEVIEAESFLDAVLRRVGYDPLDRGLRIVDAHYLPDPWPLDCPTVVVHLDSPMVLAEVTAALARLLPEGTPATLLAGLGADDAEVWAGEAAGLPAELAGVRTSLFIDPPPSGLIGLVPVVRRLRAECPWDRAQTHTSLVRHLVEEAYELVEAIATLDPDNPVTDAGLEEELGDLLLQVLLHAVIAEESSRFGIDDIATVLRDKLVRRHPHVFADVEVTGADEVAANWERIKADEREGAGADAVTDGIPAGLPALEKAEKIQRRLARVGFDWDEPGEVLAAVRTEVDELAAAIAGSGNVDHELGDLLFSVVNLARHLGAVPEVSLRRAVDRFQRRVRWMESQGPLAGLGLPELDDLWERAKRETG